MLNGKELHRHKVETEWEGWVHNRTAHHITPHHRGKPSGGGIGSPMASPYWSRKFGKLHGNLISAVALCPPTEPGPGAWRHMCDGLPADTRQGVSKADRGKSLIELCLYEAGKDLWP